MVILLVTLLIIGFSLLYVASDNIRDEGDDN
jgi:hypothetical protein